MSSNPATPRTAQPKKEQNMLTKRFLLAAVAFLSLLPFSGCGCRKSCCSNSSSFAPPPGA